LLQLTQRRSWHKQDFPYVEAKNRSTTANLFTLRGNNIRVVNPFLSSDETY